MKTLGWEVEEQEIAQAARQVTDFKVFNNLFSELHIDQPRYDVLTAWAVLEHFHDPQVYFHKAQKVLFPGVCRVPGDEP